MLNYAIKNLHSIIKEYKGIFSIFFVVSALTTFSFLYLNLYNMTLLNSGQALNTNMRTYSINGNYEIGQVEAYIAEISEKITDNSLETVVLIAQENNMDEPRCATAYMGDISKKIALDCGSTDIESGNSIIVNDMFYSMNGMSQGIGETIRVGELSGELTGIGYISNNETDAFLSYNLYKNMGYTTREIQITFQDRLSQKDYETFLSVVDIFERIEKPPVIDVTVFSQYESRIMLVILLSLIATCNVMGIYRYVIMRRRKEFLVYKICGMKGKRLKKVICTESMILMTISFVLGSVIFYIFQNIVMQDTAVSVMLFALGQTFFLQILFTLLAITPILREVNKKSVMLEHIQEGIL